MRMSRSICLYPVILFLLLACSGVEIVVTPAPVPTRETVQFTPIPVPTSLPPTPTQNILQLPTATAENISTGTYYVTTSADNVNLRTEPGTLFPVSRLLANGTRLQVRGRAPGGQWLYVLTDTNIYGWVLGAFVSGGHDGGPPPVVEPQNVQLIRGKVVDQSGVPISGIGFAFTQGAGPNAPRNDAITDSSGQFYSYMPLTSAGPWIVSYVSVSCTSNTMDANCKCISPACGRADPASQQISLPFNGTLEFIWK